MQFLRLVLVWFLSHLLMLSLQFNTMAHFNFTAIYSKTNEIQFQYQESCSFGVSNLLCDLVQLFGSVLTEGDESGCQWSTGFGQPHCSSHPQILKQNHVYLNEMKISKNMSYQLAATQNSSSTYLLCVLKKGSL